MSADWFVPLGAAGRTRLFSIPHAGAGCAQLAGLAKAMEPHRVQVLSANLPGRQARLAEPPVTDYATLVEELADGMVAHADGPPYALFGYCGGALLAYGVARALMSRSTQPPTRLIVASYEAPDIALLPRRVADLPADRLWTYLLDSGGVPDSLGADPQLRKLVEPAIRADFTALAGYRHRPGPPMPLPITVFFGERDPGTPRGALLGWRRQSERPVELRPLRCGHWLMDEAVSDLAAGIASVLEGTGT
ncbi:thioesterase II family protein [Nonomuraea purpurea]|uniref:Thioesterase II family protein n=1 Tax=Nonomuraea purpurea TaxID=1849276 RepID=A0ABV8GP91_9ACTN